MSLLETSLLLAGCVNIGIGLYALYARPRRITTYALLFFAVGLGVWVGSFFCLLYTHDFFYDKVNHYAGLVFIGGLFLLALTFPDHKLNYQHLIAYAPFLMGAIFVAHGGVVLSDTFGPGDAVTPVQGPLFPYYASGLLTYVIVSILLFVHTYRELKGVERLRMKYLFLGIVIFVIPVCVCDIALPAIGFSYLNLIGPLASVGFVIATSYGVLRHQLMDIRVVIQRGTIYSLLISFAIFAYVGLLIFISNLFDADTGMAAPLSAGIVVLIGINTVPRIERYFRKVTDRFFFKDRYDYGLALEELSGILNANIHLAELAPRLIHTLAVILKPSFVEFLHLSTGIAFDSRNRIRITESPQPTPKDGTRVAVTTSERMLGIFTFGPKRSGDPYTEEDRQLLRTFASQAAVAFEKSELYEKLEAYSKSLEEKVAERTKNLAELQTRQRELFAEISHALQTPLTILKSALELLKVSWHSENRRSLEPMQHSVDDLSRLIRDLLELARIDALPTEEESMPIDMSVLVTNVAEYVEIICQQQNIGIVKHIQSGLFIAGNEKQIEEVITNLLSNAVRYTADCPLREITLDLQRDAGSIALQIADTGVGIAESKLPHIFNRFYRGQERDVTGYGLGLAIVKRIVDRHRGTIEVRSRVGKGTTFTICLPESETLQ